MTAPAATSRPRGLRLQNAALLWLLPLVFLGYFFFFPMARILRLAVESAVTEGFTGNVMASIWRPLGFTLMQATLSTVLTLLVGLPAAYVLGRFAFPGKSVLRALTTVPFILPTVVVAAGFNALVGPRGWLNLLLMSLFHLSNPPVNILNTLWAILLAHVFYNTTVILRVVGGAWAQLDPRLEAAGRVLGASRLRNFWEVTLPLLRPAILSATLLVFLFDFTSFGVILLLGGPRFATLEVEIYIQSLQMLNLPLAGLLSAIQLFLTLILTVLYTRMVGIGEAVPLSPRLKGEGVHPPRGWGERVLVIVMVLLLVLLLVTPMLALALRSFTTFEAARGQHGPVSSGFTLDYYRALFVNRTGSIFYVPPVDAVRNSLFYAGVTVLISVALGFLAAYALNQRTRLNRFLDPVLMLPLGASAVTLGLGFIITFNRPPVDVRSFPLLIPIAHSLVALPFVVRALQPALESIPQRLRDAAAVLGASPWQVWRLVDLPILARAAMVGAIFSFTISLGEFGATTFLARPENPTMPVAIFRFLSQPGALNYGQALAMATLLMFVCAAAILVMERIRI